MLRTLAHSTEKDKAKSLPYTIYKVHLREMKRYNVKSKTKMLIEEVGLMGPRGKEGLLQHGLKNKSLDDN